MPEPTADDSGIVDTTRFAEPWVRRIVSVALAVALLVLLNLGVDSAPFWRVVRESNAARYVDHPAAWLPENLGPPTWVRGEAVLLGASNVGMAFPPDLASALLGRPVWPMWAPGINPPELLALAPYAVRAGAREVIVALELQYAAWGADIDASRISRRVFTGPLSPAWTYRRELDAPGWYGRVRALPALRLRDSLQALSAAYVTGALIEQRDPGVRMWEAMDAQYQRPESQAALAAYVADPTIARYQHYQDAVGLNQVEVLENLASIRRVQVDETLACPNIRALRDLTRYLRRHDVRVSWVLFPENPAYGQLLGVDGKVIAPAEVVAPARALLRRIAETDHVPYLDLLHLCAPEQFMDMMHVAPPARRKLGTAIRPLLENAPPT